MKINTGCWVNGCKCFNPNDEDGVEIKRDKEWAELTDDDIDDVQYNVDCRLYRDYARAIEAKLKKKNG